MRADIVTARAAVAHAAWHGRTTVDAEDIRAAARLALPHRRRRNPFDAPGLDEELLDDALRDDGRRDPEPDPPTTPARTGGGAAGATPTAEPVRRTRRSSSDPADPQTDRATSITTSPARPRAGRHARRARTARRRLAVPGLGRAPPAAARAPRPTSGRAVGSRPPTGRVHRLHLAATLRAAAPHQCSAGAVAAPRSGAARRRPARGAHRGPRVQPGAVLVDASGSMAARARMRAVKTAVLSLLLDAYQRRDKVGLVTFRGARRELAAAADLVGGRRRRRLEALPTGGRTPLAGGCSRPRDVLRVERIRDPRRRPLLVVVTDGRHTGPTRSTRSARRRHCSRRRHRAVVVDCETGRSASAWPPSSADALGAEHVPAARRPAPPATLAATVASAAAGGLMPQGQPRRSSPTDGLTTRQRRNRPLLIVHTGDGKGKSTAAFGLALRGWNQGWSIGVFQFVKTAKWRIGEQTAFLALGRAARRDRRGRRRSSGTRWARAGRGSRKPGTEDDHAADAAEGWAEIKRDLAAETHGLLRARRVHLPDQLGLGRRRRRGRGRWPNRPGHQHVVITGRERAPDADRGRRPGHRDDQGQAPDGRRPEGPAGHRVVTHSPGW